MPGPLLTYTIARTLRTREQGWLVGARVIAGHAALECVLVFGLVFGVVGFLRAPAAAKAIGIGGAALLLFMGAGLIRETVRGKGMDLGAGDAPPDGEAAGRASLLGRMDPVAAGALVSMSNPYWWIWWVTVGAAFLLRFDITLARWPALAAFFLGHELGDLGWYSAVSILLHLGRRRIPRGFTTAVLLVCGVAIIGFGAWLGISPFLGK